MIIGRPVIRPTDQRFFHIHFPWLLDGELIDTALVDVIPPPPPPGIEYEEGEEPTFTLSGTIDIDQKTLILKTNPVSGVTPPLQGTEYIVDINIMTTLEQVNQDQLIFIIDEGAY